MSFQSLKVDELKDVAEFFAVDVEASDPEHGPTKKELQAALASGDEPVTWDDYNEIYLPAKESGQDRVHNDAPELTELPQPEVEEVEEEDDSDKVLVRFIGKNPRRDEQGLTWTQKHPFHSVEEDKAEKLVRTGRYRLALPSEVKDFYN